jgi:molybdopterin converting factor small subunit
MQIKIRYFAGLKDITKKREEILLIEERSNIDTGFIREKMNEMYGIDNKHIYNIVINGVLGKKEIKDGDIISIHPIYRGG